MLTTKVETPDDLMTIALQAEREAIRRYSQLVTAMRAGNNNSAAALFERMITEEKQHERLLTKWMKHEGLQENPAIAPVKWRDPQVSTIYDEEARDPDYSTPYKALAFAVHNEEIAFRFYTQVAADSVNETVRKYAEILAREELGHAALLRAERRRAYHTERETDSVETRLDHRAVHSESDLLTAAIHIDRRLANTMTHLAGDSPEIKQLVRKTQEEIDSYEGNLDKISSANADIVKNLEQVDAYIEKMEKLSSNTDEKLHQLYACCDRSFSFYDEIVSTTSDEKVMLTAQKLASSALDRIAALKEVPVDVFMTAQTYETEPD